MAVRLDGLIMRKSFFPGTTGIFCLFFIPYLITIVFNGVESTLVNRKFDMEMILPVMWKSDVRSILELTVRK